LILQVAVPVPLRRLFDYLPPVDDHAEWVPGTRLLVPFAKQQLVAILIATTEQSELPTARLRPIIRRLDPEPILPPELLTLLQWAADYYHHPLGEVLHSALPQRLRQPRGVAVRVAQRWILTRAGSDCDATTLQRAPRQQALLQQLQQRPQQQGISAADGDQLPTGWQPALRQLQQRQLVESVPACLLPPPTHRSAPPPLTAAQQAAIKAVSQQRTFHTFLLDGVTGSGKSEVYLQLIERVIERGEQALLLVPEIGLTPQLLTHCRQRLRCPIALLHSNLAAGERLTMWQLVRRGEVALLIGTRSALLAPFQRLALIVVDEEHDSAYKQHDGFRYSARDLAIVRAARSNIPILLGSATPALESHYNATIGRYTRLQLPQRVGGAELPRLRLIDLRRQKLLHGLSGELIAIARQHLKADGQILLFLNRRGYAPQLQCSHCGWVADCHACDAHLVLYRNHQLRCHHCGATEPQPPRCRHCGGATLEPLGQGTERIEAALQHHFPHQARLRIDRDATRQRGELTRRLAAAAAGEVPILIGTQMIAKGHHFPGVTLVAVVDADSGLFSTDFRAGERLLQQVVQVAGRAGRAERRGEVVIQSRQPDHPLLQALIRGDYAQAVATTLAERQASELPPFSYLALLRAEADDATTPFTLLDQAAAIAARLQPMVQRWGPAPAPIERRAHRYHARLLLQSLRRDQLQQLLPPLLTALEQLPIARSVRWSLDVDPIDG